MSTATTDTFQSNCDEIIAAALTNLGAIGPGGTPTAKQRAHAFKALNRIVKSVDADGDFLWRTERRGISITAGTASYGPSIVGTDVLGLEDPCDFMLTGQTSRTQVYMMSNADFRKLADRTTTGTPSQYLIERTLSGLTLTLWPVPDQAGSLEMMAALRAKDFVLGTNTPDFTSKWDICLVAGLTAECCPAYGQTDSMGTWTKKFEAEKMRLLNNDNEQGPLTLVPWGDMGGGYSGV